MYTESENLDIRDWRISDALDRLEPIFRESEMEAEQIDQTAKVLGMPCYALWTAHHLYEVIKEMG